MYLYIYIYTYVYTYIYLCANEYVKLVALKSEKPWGFCVFQDHPKCSETPVALNDGAQYDTISCLINWDVQDLALPQIYHSWLFSAGGTNHSEFLQVSFWLLQMLV